ncbi:MAG: glycosyltransferase, partial [Lachnospiraceae bacterium]|nr:glycosyltransferase [Lachnospiraceae bacterium]
MRLVIDCFKQVKGAGKSIGIYNLARHLVWELAGNHCSQKNAQNEIIVLGNRYNKKDFDVAGVTFIEIKKNPLNKLTCMKWELFDVSVLAKKLRADKVLFPRGYASMLHLTKEYVIIHDMIPFYYDEHYKGYFNRLENFYIMWRLKASARRADKVITISEASKRDIIKYAHTDERRITVIHNGYTPINKGTYAEGDGNYIVAMTSKLPHKNAKGIARVYAYYRKLAANPLPLTIIGTKKVDMGEIDGAVEGITWIAYVEQD